MNSNYGAMEQIARGLPSKSAKMRALAKAGYRRTEIAKFLDVRYQFVRNVLVEAERQRTTETPSASDVGPSDAEANSRVNLKGTKLRIDSEGRVALPTAFREALSLNSGDALIASVEDGALHLLTIPAAVRRVQAMVRQFVPEGVSLVDELLEDRRREMEREASE